MEEIHKPISKKRLRETIIGKIRRKRIRAEIKEYLEAIKKLNDDPNIQEHEKEARIQKVMLDKLMAKKQKLKWFIKKNLPHAVERIVSEIHEFVCIDFDKICTDLFLESGLPSIFNSLLDLNPQEYKKTHKLVLWAYVNLSSCSEKLMIRLVNTGLLSIIPPLLLRPKMYHFELTLNLLYNITCTSINFRNIIIKQSFFIELTEKDLSKFNSILEIQLALARLFSNCLRATPTPCLKWASS